MSATALAAIDLILGQLPALGALGGRIAEQIASASESTDEQRAKAAAVRDRLAGSMDRLNAAADLAADRIANG